MGIQYLNRYLMDHCSKTSIRKIKFAELSGKIIVVDASIYIYKYVGEDALIENMYLLVSILLYYKIIPIFIFDGKPPEEKRELIYQRKLRKQQAEKEYNDVKNNAKDGKFDKEVIEKMEILKRQFIRINSYHISITKQLLCCYGIQYYEADGEADELCARLLENQTAWACLSDDMDMFVYGCNRILRQVSLLNHTCTLYDMSSILHDLQMDIHAFRKITVLSGTDYNTVEKIHLSKAFKLYNEYINFHKTTLPFLENTSELQRDSLVSVPPKSETASHESFYMWLHKNKYIRDLDALQKAYDMFILTYTESDNIGYVSGLNKCNKDDLYKILQLEGFLT